MAKIDELIRQAQDALNKAKDDEKPVAQAKLDALKSVKAAGVEMSNDEVNGLVTRKSSEVDDKWKDVVGVSREELGELLDDQTLQELFSDLEDGDEDNEGKPTLERIQEALKSRDAQIESLGSTLTDVNRRYSSDKVEVAIEKAFRDAGLDDTFLVPAKDLAKYDDLVKKVAEGKPVTREEIQGKVENVKTLSDVWFKDADGQENGDKDGRTVAGVKLKEEVVRPHIPATPDSTETAEITDDDRAARASSVY